MSRPRSANGHDRPVDQCIQSGAYGARRARICRWRNVAALGVPECECQGARPSTAVDCVAGYGCVVCEWLRLLSKKFSRLRTKLVTRELSLASPLRFCPKYNDWCFSHNLFQKAHTYETLVAESEDPEVGIR